MNKLSYALGIGIGTQLSQLGTKEIVLDDFSQGIALVPFLGIVDLLAQLKSIKCVVENNKLLHAFHWSLNRLSDYLLRTALGCQVIFHCTGSE